MFMTFFLFEKSELNFDFFFHKKQTKLTSILPVGFLQLVIQVT